MKKTYSTPLTEVVKINTEQLICQSLEVPIGDSVPIDQGESGNILGKDDEDISIFW